MARLFITFWVVPALAIQPASKARELSMKAAEMPIKAFRQGRSFALTGRGVGDLPVCIGGQCTAEQVERLLPMSDAAETHTPPECSSPPPVEDNYRPISEVKVGKAVEADCYLNYYPACTAAKRAGDYAAYALNAATSVPFYRGYEEDLGGFRTTKGVSALEAKLCVEHGWLDLPKDLILNNTAVEEEADRHCQRLEAMFPGWGKNLSWAQFLDTCDEEGDWFPPGRADLGFISREEMLRHEVWKCEMGRHVLACDMAECVYNFCWLPDGRVGTGMNCREDWLDPAFVDKHFWSVFGPK